MIRNNVRSFKNGNTQSTIEQARAVAKNLGLAAGAGMLRNKGFSVEAAIYVLLGK